MALSYAGILNKFDQIIEALGDCAQELQSSLSVPAVVSEMNRTMGRAIEKLLTPLSAGWSAGSIAAKRN